MMEAVGPSLWRKLLEDYVQLRDDDAVIRVVVL